jgi:hypothetical protein
MPANEETTIAPWQPPETETEDHGLHLDNSLRDLQIAVSGYLSADKRSRSALEQSTNLILSELANTRAECRRVNDAAIRKNARILQYHRRQIIQTIITAASLGVIALWFLLALAPKNNAQSNTQSRLDHPTHRTADLHPLAGIQSRQRHKG